MTAALTAEGIHTYYGKSHILHGVSLEVAEGKITALLGRNGAGKTTTLRSLMGLTPAREGKIVVFGQDTTRWPTFRIAAQGVGYVPEGRRIFANLSVEENLKVPLERVGPWAIPRIYQLFPPPRRAQAQPRPPAFRRRTGDAVDRSRAAAEPTALAPGHVGRRGPPGAREFGRCIVSRSARQRPDGRVDDPAPLLTAI